ncbi:MAG: hypothetical protein Q9222_000730 [Ikaeria aurantiellina]
MAIQTRSDETCASSASSAPFGSLWYPDIGQIFEYHTSFILGDRDLVRSNVQVPTCVGYKFHLFDWGPCGSKAINYTAIFFIVSTIFLLCRAIYWKIKRPKNMEQHSQGLGVIQRIRQKRSNEGQRKEPGLEDDFTHRRIRCERRRRAFHARAMTDLSGQQDQLAQRWAAIQAQLLSAVVDYGNRLRSTQEDRRRDQDLEAGHLRDMRMGEQIDHTDTAGPAYQMSDFPPSYAVGNPHAEQQQRSGFPTSDLRDQTLDLPRRPDHARVGGASNL